MRISSSGELHPVELYGPVCFEAWYQSFMGFHNRVGCLMLGQIASGTCRYGKESWVIIYQADVRARLGQIERARRRGAVLPEGSVTNGVVLQKDKPWEWSLREAWNDHPFWRKEPEEPTLLVLSRAAKINTMAEGDAPTAAAGGGQHHATASHQQQEKYSGGGKKEKLRPPKQHLTDESGALAHNRRGISLCTTFQQDQCGSAVRGKCPRDSSRVHQCSKWQMPLAVAQRSIVQQRSGERVHAAQAGEGQRERWGQEGPPAAVLSRNR